jgi:hypothetical protein
VKDTKACAGCRDDFYNGKNPLSVKRCWSADGASIVAKWRTGTWTVPTQPGAFTEVCVPNCYHAEGYSFRDNLPAFALDPLRLKVVS